MTDYKVPVQNYEITIAEHFTRYHTLTISAEDGTSAETLALDIVGNLAPDLEQLEYADSQVIEINKI